MKRYYFTLLWMLISISMLAVPAKRNLTRTITLSDGTTVNARLVGDEFGHFWQTNNGKAYQKINSEYFTEVDAEAVKQQAQARRTAVNARRVQRLQGRRVGEVGSYFGQKRGLIILVNYSDVSFRSSNDSARYVRIANEVNFHEGNFVGSIYDYFYAQSDGQFELTFDVMGPVTMPKTQSYYGSNDYSGNDKHPGEMVRKAVELIKDQVEDWSQYDWDNDDYVDQVYVIYAGKGEADGGADDTIWPHAWDLNSSGAGAVSVGNGLKVNNYACGSELGGNGQIEGIGTMCHEFSHCLGYPDFYDTDYSGGQGMDAWDLMDYGSYNDNGFRPAGYTSYERWMAGWKQPIELNMGKSRVENMKGLQDGGDFYVMYNDGHPDEYFLLENRSHSGWDAGVPGFGLLILHVDYNAYVWSSNQPNDDPSHQRMTWIPSDGSYSGNASNDVYPNMNDNNAFNDTSSPAAVLYNKNTDGVKLLHKGIKNIVKNPTGTISFDFTGVSTVKTPVISPQGGRFYEPQEVTITCATEETTIYYTTDGSDPTTSSDVYTEPFTIDKNATIKAMAATADEESLIAEAIFSFVIVNATNDSVDYVWREDFTGYAENTPVEDVANENAFYEGDNGNYCVIYNNKWAGGTAPELLIPQKNRSANFVTANIAVGSLSGDFELSFRCNRKLSVTSPTEGVEITVGEKTGYVYRYTIHIPENTPMLKLTLTNTLSQNARLDDIVLMKPEEKLIKPLLAFEQSSYNTQAKDSLFVSPQLNNKYGVPVAYESTDPKVAAVDSKTGVVTIGKAGSATIKAVFEGDEKYAADVASYELIVEYLNPELSFMENEVEAIVGIKTFHAPKLVNPHKLSVVYSSSDKSLAVVDEQGEVMLGADDGRVTITATFEGDDYYEAGDASYDIVLLKGETGISTLTGEQSAGEWYTIQGVRVDKPAKGLYIYQGRKRVIK